MPIERDLRGKRFFVTGATGFLGTALVERILRCLPEAEITVLIRPGRRADASARLAREVIKNDCFDRLRRELGDGFADEVGPPGARRAGRRRPATGSASTTKGARPCAAADVVIHSAATVSFDAPLTQAVEINLLGPSRVAAAMADCGSNGHLIAVSTAYVASTHQGEAKEELLSENPFTLDVPWQDEVAFARRLRDDLQAESRMAGQAEGVHEEGPQRDRSRRRPPDRRREPRSCARSGSSDELVKAGTARALSLGWPDAYPFTKALGEKALVEQWEGKVPITFVRPSIIESALAEPRPGWIRGFRMAEPIIISYARGLLRRVPRRARGHHRRDPGRPRGGGHPGGRGAGTRSRDGRRCTTSPRACGTRCATGAWSRSRRASSSATRSTTTAASPSACPSGRSPDAGGCSASSGAPTPLMTFAEKLITALPIRGRQAQLAARIEDRHAMAKRALGYVELYGAYTETDARYRVDNLLELWDAVRQPRTTRGSGSIPASSTGTATCSRSTCRRCSSTPGCARSRGARWSRSGPTGSARRSCRPTGIWPCSTSSTRSCPPTSSTPTPGWPAATCPPARRARFVADLRAPGPGAAGARPARPGRLPELVLPALRGRAAWRSCARTRGSSSTASC